MSFVDFVMCWCIVGSAVVCFSTTMSLCSNDYANKQRIMMMCKKTWRAGPHLASQADFRGACSQDELKGGSQHDMQDYQTNDQAAPLQPSLHCQICNMVNWLKHLSISSHFLAISSHYIVVGHGESKEAD